MLRYARHRMLSWCELVQPRENSDEVSLRFLKLRLEPPKALVDGLTPFVGRQRRFCQLSTGRAHMHVT